MRMNVLTSHVAALLGLFAAAPYSHPKLDLTYRPAPGISPSYTKRGPGRKAVTGVRNDWDYPARINQYVKPQGSYARGLQNHFDARRSYT